MKYRFIAIFMTVLCCASLWGFSAFAETNAEYIEDTSTSISTETEASDTILETETETSTEPYNICKEYPQITAFIERIYENILERKSDPSGLENWVSCMVNQNFTASQVLEGFFQSEEFLGKSVSAETYIKILYQTLLGRIPSQPEVDSWLARKNMGVTNRYLLCGFIKSAEFQNICNSYGVKSGEILLEDPKDQNIQITAFCARMYTCCLQRNYDEQGLTHWADLMVRGEIDASELARRFYFSQEYLSKNVSIEDTIRSLYHSFLNREPQDFEVERWAERKRNGVSDTYLLYGFSASIEFGNICKAYQVPQGKITLTEARDCHPLLAQFVVNAYKPLERIPLGGEINGRINRILNGASALDTILSVMTSQEYQNKQKSDTDIAMDMIQSLCGREASEEEIEAICDLLQNQSYVKILYQYSAYDDFTAYCNEKEILQISYYQELLFERLDALQWDIQSAFQWCSTMQYESMATDTVLPVTWYAQYGFENRKGNAYVMASTFCTMARAMGYSCNVVTGRIPLRAGGYGTHAWCEIIVDDIVYVCDPDYTYNTGRNGFLITYGQAGTWKYVRDAVL